MHSLEIIHARDVHAVVKEYHEALADGDAAGLARAQRIAKANPDVFTHDGRRRT